MGTSLPVSFSLWVLIPPPGTQSKDLRGYFTQFGRVEDTVVIMDRETPERSRCFGFVTFSSAYAANAVITAAHGQDLQVQFSRATP